MESRGKVLIPTRVEKREERENEVEAIFEEKRSDNFYEPMKKISAESFRIIHESQAGYIRGNPHLDT